MLDWFYLRLAQLRCMFIRQTERVAGLECYPNLQDFSTAFLEDLLGHRIKEPDSGQDKLLDFMRLHKERASFDIPYRKYENIPLLTLDLKVQDNGDFGMISTRWHVDSDTPYLSSVYGRVEDEPAAPILFIFNPEIISGPENLISSYFTGRQIDLTDTGFSVKGPDRLSFRHEGRFCNSEAYSHNLRYLFLK